MKAHGLNPRIRKSPIFDATVKYGATEFHSYKRHVDARRLRRAG